MVGNPYQCLVQFLSLQLFENLSLGIGVKGRRCLIHNQDGTWLEQGTGDGDTLCLSFGKATSLLAAQSVEPTRQIIDEKGAGPRQGIMHLLFGSIELAKLEVVAYRAAQEAVALGHIRYGIFVGIQRKCIALRIDEAHVSSCRTKQAEEDTHQGALAAARRANDGCACGRCKSACEIIEHVMVAIRIAIGNVLKLQT